MERTGAGTPVRLLQLDDRRACRRASTAPRRRVAWRWRRSPAPLDSPDRPATLDVLVPSERRQWLFSFEPCAPPRTLRICAGAGAPASAPLSSRGGADTTGMSARGSDEGCERRHRCVERGAHRRAHRDQPVLPAREDVRELGLRAARRAHPRRVDRRDEARRRRSSSASSSSRACPTCSASDKLHVGETVPEQLKSRPRARVRRRRRGSTTAIALCRDKGDNGTARPARGDPRRPRRSTSTGSRPSSASSSSSARPPTSPSRSASRVGWGSPSRGASPCTFGGGGRADVDRWTHVRGARTRARAYAPARHVVVIARRPVPEEDERGGEMHGEDSRRR